MKHRPPTLTTEETFKRLENHYNPNLVAQARRLMGYSMLELHELQLILLDLGVEFQIAPAATYILNPNP